MHFIPCSTTSFLLPVMTGTLPVSPASFLPQTSAVSAVWSSNLASPLKPWSLQGNPLNCCLLSILATSSFLSRTNRWFLKTPAISHLPLIPLTSPFNLISLQNFLFVCHWQMSLWYSSPIQPCTRVRVWPHLGRVCQTRAGAVSICCSCCSMAPCRAGAAPVSRAGGCREQLKSINHPDTPGMPSDGNNGSCWEQPKHLLENSSVNKSAIEFLGTNIKHSGQHPAEMETRGSQLSLICDHAKLGSSSADSNASFCLLGKICFFARVYWEGVFLSLCMNHGHHL